jgi:L-asparagine transporter-like permease
VDRDHGARRDGQRASGAGSFGVYAERYLNPWAGFVGALWLLVRRRDLGGGRARGIRHLHGLLVPNVPPLVWILVYAAVLLAINLRQVGDYGRFEYWFAMVKVATIVFFVVVGGALLFGGRVDAQYTAAGGSSRTVRSGRSRRFRSRCSAFSASRWSRSRPAKRVGRAKSPARRGSCSRC